MKSYVFNVAYLFRARFNKERGDGGDAGCDTEEPPDASDDRVQDVLPAVDVVIGIAEGLGNTLWRQTTQLAFF